MKLAFNKPRKVTKPDFQKKIWFIHKVQKCTFLSGFSTFSGNLAMNFHLFLIENDSTKCLWTACENRMFSKNPVLEIFIHKVEILAKNGKKWCLKIVLYLQNRKCYRKSDLIFGIYDKFSFLYVSSDFCLLVVFMVKKWLEDGQFSCTFLSGFRLISRQRLDRFGWNLVRSETGSIQRRHKRPDVKIFSQSGDIKPRIAKNRPKINQNLWMIQKIFEKNFFGLNASKWSNSKSYHVKSEIWRPSKNFPLLGHQSWRLRKFSKFFEKIFFAQMLPNGPIRKVITLKVKFEDLRLHLSLWRHGSRLRKFFDT